MCLGVYLVEVSLCCLVLCLCKLCCGVVDLCVVELFVFWCFYDVFVEWVCGVLLFDFLQNFFGVRFDVVEECVQFDGLVEVEFFLSFFLVWFFLLLVGENFIVVGEVLVLVEFGDFGFFEFQWMVIDLMVLLDEIEDV